jgi:hypothetical protein
MEHAMTTIGGPGGIGGPKAPAGPEGPSELSDVDHISSDVPVEQAQEAARTSDLEALAAEVGAGHLTQREAIDRLVEATAGPGLDAAERAELRELLADLVANDPHLGGLAGRI